MHGPKGNVYIKIGMPGQQNTAINKIQESK